MGIGAPDAQSPRSLGLVVLGTALASVGVAVLVLAFLGWVEVIWAAIVFGALIAALAVLAGRRATATERSTGGGASEDPP